MTTTEFQSSAEPSPADGDPDRSVTLRSSRELEQVPPERPPAPRAGPLATPMTPVQRFVAQPPAELTWSLASLTLLAGLGWTYERRRRRLREREDVTAWENLRDNLRVETDLSDLDAMLSGGADSGPASRAAVQAGISDTPSRREATLIDLHLLHDRLRQLRNEHDAPMAVELLERHLVDFRYTSPWVFLELRELYKQLAQPHEWELAREAFRKRFGQNAPQWSASSTAASEIADDRQLCADLLRRWPYREAHLFILRWVLGDAISRQKSCGPPQLPLGIYRDMLLLDAMLDEVMIARPAVPSAA